MEVEPPIKRFWARVKIRPQKWNLSPWGDEGGGFWVVALIGQECIFYNDIEDGFNISRFSAFGCIDDYWCNQSELALCINSFCRAFMREIGELSVPDAVKHINAPDSTEMYRLKPEFIDHQ